MMHNTSAGSEAAALSSKVFETCDASLTASAKVQAPYSACMHRADAKKQCATVWQNRLLCLSTAKPGWKAYIMCFKSVALTCFFLSQYSFTN